MPDQPAARNDQGVRHGLRVSEISLVWTVLAGAGAVVIGVVANTVVLIAFGLIGLMDGVGSATLIVHFRHALHHEAISERHEAVALRVVTVGMAAIGILTVAYSAYRLASQTNGGTAVAGIVLSGISVVVLATLAVSKRRIAKRIPSHALHADGWLSGMGAILALVALAGTGLDRAFGWWWIDPLAAIGVGCGAITLSVILARPERSAAAGAAS